MGHWSPTSISIFSVAILGPKTWSVACHEGHMCVLLYRLSSWTAPHKLLPGRATLHISTRSEVPGRTNNVSIHTSS